MPSQIERIEAHAGHLLDAFILLRERYAMLAPMLFDKEIVAIHGANERSRGFEILRNTLFLSCAQDIAKLAMDDYDRSPSIRKLVSFLTDEKLRAEFRLRYANWAISQISHEDPEVIAAIQKMQVKDQGDRRENFDKLYCEVTELWSQLSTSSEMKAFKTIRDKISAHTEVHFSADKYQFVDVSALGLKWGDLKKTINTMERLVDLFGILIRNAGFAWDMLDNQLDKASENYWKVIN